MDNNTEDFKEVFDIVVERMQRGEEMMTAREELMADFIEKWAEVFGYDSILGDSDK